MTDVTDGRRGYQAFGDSMRWKNAEGSPMPHWSRLHPREQEAWELQAKTVIAASRRRVRGPTNELRVHSPGYGTLRTLCGLVRGGLVVTEKSADVTCGRCKRAGG